MITCSHGISLESKCSECVAEGLHKSANHEGTYTMCNHNFDQGRNCDCRVIKLDDWGEVLRRVFVPDVKRRVKSKKQRTQDKHKVDTSIFDAPF